MNSNSAAFDQFATYDDGSCPPVYLGCTDHSADNFRAVATVDDGSCAYVGCLSSLALNYNPSATYPGSCTPRTFGCTDSHAANYYPSANTDDGGCLFTGCTDSSRSNYDLRANVDSGLCIPWFFGCTDRAAANYHPFYTRLKPSSCVYLGCMDASFDNYDTRNTFDFSPSACSNHAVSRRFLSSRRRLVACPDPAASNYNLEGDCLYPVRGCTDSGAFNYASGADMENCQHACIEHCATESFFFISSPPIECGADRMWFELSSAQYHRIAPIPFVGVWWKTARSITILMLRSSRDASMCGLAAWTAWRLISTRRPTHKMPRVRTKSLAAPLMPP